VDQLAGKGVQGVIDEILHRPALAAPDPELSDDGSWAPVKWWLARMSDPHAGIHERMTWFWHGLVTVSHDKVFWWNVEWRAHKLLRRYALGDHRALLKKMTVTPAMLIYLDGSWSTVQGPNENYSRELMELFTIGQENVSQRNVENGALALAGWYVDWETATAHFIDERWASLGANQKVPYLGRQVYRYDEVVDAACAHSATARYIANKLWYQLVGVKPSSTKLSHVASVYRSSGLSNRRLVETIVRDPVFLQKRLTRPRTPVEWVIPAMAAMGMAGDRERMVDQLWQMGQLPFYPPSVAGWPTGLRWLSPSLALAKAALAVDSPAIKAVADAHDQVAKALERCSLFEVSARTRRALTRVKDDGNLNRTQKATILLALCLASPEFALA
jgi:uncharacterized protein (DUF1800 family)